jgi:diaminopimelate epimerase
VEKSKEKTLKFYKFEGTGNDFVIIDSRFNEPLENPSLLGKMLLDRHFSIGGDSLLYLEESKTVDIKMRVFEIDGTESSMCGNGARCIGAYLDKFFNKDECKIETLAGIKHVKKLGENEFELFIGKMQKLGKFVKDNKEKTELRVDLFGLEMFVVNSSEPHAVIITDNIKKIPVKKAIKIAKYKSVFPYGINVNFVEIESSSTFYVRTVERGIYGETLACGTGTVSSAYVLNRNFNSENVLTAKAKGGELKVRLTEKGNYLSGQAKFVFAGETTLEI